MTTKLRYALGALLVATTIGLLTLFPPIRSHAQFSATQTWAGTAGGTVNALTLNIHNVAQLNDLLGVPIRFLPSGVNTQAAALTINLDGGGTLAATPIDRPTSNLGLRALSSGELQTGVMTELTYDGTEFVITSNIDMTPIGQTVDLRQSSGTAPTGYLLEDGSCYLRTTYAALFAVIGTTYNAGAPVACSGTQFAVPFANGTLNAAIDNQGVNGAAARITNAGSGCTATAVGTLCGNQSQTLTANQLPTVISSNPAGIGISTTSTSSSYFLAGSSAQTTCNASAGGSCGSSTTGTTIGTFISSNGSIGIGVAAVQSTNTGGLPHPILNPVILTYKAIKF